MHLMLMKFRRRGLAALGLAALASGAALADEAGARGRPALWQVSDRDTTVYLFGTIHLLPKDYAWRTPAFEKAVAGSQSLVVETIIDSSNPMALAGEMARLGFRPDLTPISNRVPAAKP